MKMYNEDGVEVNVDANQMEQFTKAGYTRNKPEKVDKATKLKVKEEAPKEEEAPKAKVKAEAPKAKVKKVKKAIKK